MCPSDAFPHQSYPGDAAVRQAATFLLGVADGLLSSEGRAQLRDAAQAESATFPAAPWLMALRDAKAPPRARHG